MADGSGQRALGRRERMRAACLGQPVDRPPVWVMRQAGRYLPEYWAIRESTSFLERCRDPELAAQIALQPYERFGMDAVVIFSDILLPLTALGLDLDFQPGPIVANPLPDPDRLELLEGSAAEAMAPTAEAIRRVLTTLDGEAAVIGFAGAPWTLAAYASEERLSRDLSVLCAWTWREPAAVERLLDRLADVCAETLRVQIDAGADVLQIFDTWAGMLSAPQFRRFAGAALRAVLDRLPDPRPPVIVYARGASHLTDEIADLGCDVVSIDWRVDLAAAARRLGARVSLQGNLDPAALHAEPEQIRAAVAQMLADGRAARGHIANLGHGVQPNTPIAGVRAFIEAVQESG